MAPKIFDIENGRLIVNEHILSIPELKAVYEGYSDPEPPLLYLRNLCDPYSPYNNIEEEIKEEVKAVLDHYTPHTQLSVPV